ncbi:MAG TPA: VOC family protein [Bryobacteraceae bacterium]|nr:VOC family protein [Bryobacteraceae bacterium]
MAGFAPMISRGAPKCIVRFERRAGQALPPVNPSQPLCLFENRRGDTGQRLSRLVFLAALTTRALWCADATAPAHFHHLHLNSTDPANAIDFYTRTFDCEKARFAGVMDAVWAQKSWLLFTKVSAAPPSDILSAIWHFGWGAEDMPDAYRKQLAKGTKFGTPITELFPKFWYAYVDGPDKAIIELNTAPHHDFGHLHLVSEDAVTAGEWYQKHFGATWKAGRPPAREKRFIREFQIGPNASLMMDNVNIIIFPIEYARQAMPEWKGRAGFESSKGRVVDHVGFGVDNLEQSLDRLRKEGVTVTDDVKTAAGGRIRHAFIEGPDKIRIELVEGRARRE